MTSPLSFLKKINYVFDLKYFSYLPIIFSFLILTILEIFSLGLIIPYMNLIFKPEVFSNFQLINKISFLDGKDNQELILYFSFLFIVVFAINTFLVIFVRAFIKKFSLLRYKILQINLMNVYQNMSYEDYNKKKHSEYVRNIREMSSYSMICLESSLRVLSEIIILLSIVIFLIFIEPIPLLTISLVMISFLSFYNFYLKPKTVLWGRKKAEATKTIYQSIDESFKGFKEIKTLRKQQFFSTFLKKGTEIVFKNDLKSSIIMASPRYILELIIVIFIISILGLSVFFNGLNFDFFPIIAIFALAGLRILPSIALISNDILQVGFYLEGLKTIYNDLKTLRKKNTEREFKQKYLDFEKIELKNISFSYQGISTKVLDSVDLKIENNQFVGIVGNTGSGKTTLLDLFLGLLKPTEGDILVNDKKVTGIPISNLINIGYLPQENFIINDTIISNISLSYENESINLKKIENILIQLDLKNFINKLPNGINSIIGEKGLKLSGGQRQKICLARLLYHNKKIMILDEATNALDKESEKKVIEVLKNLKDKTIILISHDHNNLRFCDKIFKINNNKITILNN